MNVSRGWVGAVATVVMFAALAGCKSGTSFAKPSWWTFGGTSNADAEKLATAPPYGEAGKTDGAIPKPSASATPYPTTTTPNGYAMAGAAAAPPAAVAAAAPADAPITYGKTLPPAPPATASAGPLTAAAAAPAAVAAAPPISAQAGPYATIPTPPPAASAPVTQPPDRYADARGFEPSAPAAPTAPTASAFGGITPAEAAAADSRYGSASGSRFSGDSSGGLLPVPAASPSFGTGAAPAAAPAAPATSLPTMPPTRRPDPGYRPGGTTSYRPSKTILVGEPAAESAVRTAAFEAPVQPVRQ